MSSQGDDHYVERVKRGIWLLPQEQHSAIIGKVVMAQEKRVLYKNRFWQKLDCGYDGGWPTTKNLLDSLIKQSFLESSTNDTGKHIIAGVSNRS